MNTLTYEDLRTLVEPQGGPCVSIYMHTNRVGETTQNPIRFKNMLRQAEEELRDKGTNTLVIQELLEPAVTLTRDVLFWQYQSDSLAVFLSTATFRYFMLPHASQDLVIVGDQFYIKPLLPFLSGDGRFYVLTLSLGGVKLLRGSRFHLEQVELKGVPQNRREALRMEDTPEVTRWYPGAGGGVGGARPQAMYYSQGEESDLSGQQTHEFFLQVEAGVNQALAGEQAPLVLAGLEEIVPAYRNLNHYNHIAREAIIGNPEELSEVELHQRAWAIVQPQFEWDRQAAIERYRRAAAVGGPVRSTVDQVVPAAYYGQVDTLLVADGIQHWGRLDPDSGEVQQHAERGAQDVDLLDLAAVHTLLNGGTVYVIAAEEMPEKAPLAAILRY